jgi:glycosyltransferase involved in cell wall biosynthesis
MDSTELGICIPTYRRPDQLTACVRSVIASAGDAAIPIFISDDATDGTNAEAIGRLQREYPHIVWSRNPANLGIDGNILQSVNICSCRYAWVIGEDDRMTRRAVARVLPLVRAGEQWPFVFVNYASTDPAVRFVLRARALPLEADSAESAEAFLAGDAWAMGFIGACVIRKEDWARVRQEKYVGTFFAHAGVILEALRGRQLFKVADSLVVNRVGSGGMFSWSRHTFDVMTGWRRMTEMLARVYGEELCRASADAFDRHQAWSALAALAAARAERLYDRAAYTRYLRHLPRGAGYHRAARMIAGAPPAGLRVARGGFRLLRSVVRDGRLPRLEL